MLFKKGLERGLFLYRKNYVQENPQPVTTGYQLNCIWNTIFAMVANSMIEKLNSGKSMKRFKTGWLLLLAQLVASSNLLAKTDPHQVLITVMDNYFEESLQYNPLKAMFMGDYRFNDQWVNNLSDDFLKKAHAFNEKYLAQIKAIDRQSLSPEDQNSYDLFLWDRQITKEGEQFPSELLPINQFSSMPNFFAQLGSGQSAQPFKTLKDYQDFLKRIDGFISWVDTAEMRMKQGINSGIVAPRSLMVKVIPQLSAMLVEDYKKSIFWMPIRNLPNSIPAEDTIAISKAYQNAIVKKLIPAYRKLRDFLKNAYLPKARSTSGLSGLKDGKKWYQWYIKMHTTTADLTAAQIHKIGLDEVDRIHREMKEVKNQLKFNGSLQQFFKHLQNDEKFYFKNDKEVMERYQQERKRVEKVLPEYFDKMPKAPFEIRAVEKFRAQSAAGASYEAGTPDGKRPGIFYINTFNLKAQPKFGVETLFLHEAEPGHHFQISLAQEQIQLPRYQRFANFTAFAEGWALYAESIGKEMGLFTDPLQYYGRLSDELLRAMRLVMDTGLHAKGWSREKAIKYMMDNSSMAESDVIAEVERYMAIPGQALSYKIGQFRISALRRWAEKQLGDKFDIREFHNQVLLSGALPLSVLDAKIKRWVATLQQMPEKT